MPTPEQSRLLYLISLHAKPSRKDEEKALWVRELPLRALMFEGIRNNVFDWDYAPASVMTAEGRVFMNISQEGEDDINDLREAGLLDALKLSTSRHHYITAFCPTVKGLEEVAKVSAEDRSAVDALLRCRCGGRLGAEERDGKVIIKCASCRTVRESGMMDTEDVSYISKACIPKQPNISLHRGV